VRLVERAAGDRREAAPARPSLGLRKASGPVSAPIDVKWPPTYAVSPSTSSDCTEPSTTGNGTATDEAPFAEGQAT